MQRQSPDPEALNFGDVFDYLQGLVERSAESRDDFENWEVSWFLDDEEKGPCSTGVSGMTQPLMHLLRRLIRHHWSEGSWTTIHVSRNLQSPLGMRGHEDPECYVWVVALGHFKAGGLWIESEAVDGPVVKGSTKGGSVAGHVVCIKNFPVQFLANRPHVVEPWTAGDMWVIKDFTRRSVFSEDRSFCERLESLDVSEVTGPQRGRPGFR